MKPERWGSLLVQEKYREEMPVTKTSISYNNNNNNNNNKEKGIKLYNNQNQSTLWNQQVRTDRTIPNNKTDIIIRDNKQGPCMLIDAAIPGDRNVTKKEAEKILNYADLITEIQRMCSVKAKVIPVITGATGTISKSLRLYLGNIRGKQAIKKLQKQTAHILQKVLM